MSFQFSEDDLEQVALEWFEELGYTVKNGREISETGITPERESDKDVVLDGRLEAALKRINPELHKNAIQQAIHEISIEKSPNLLENNRTFHEMITNGIEVEHYNDDGETINDLVYVFDFNNPRNNDFLAVNQLTIVNGEYNKRPDIILFINGLPVVVIELKSSTNESVGVVDGYHQLETYKMRIPQLFNHNAVLV
ncbi:MAG: type I restriction endonuclease, partial [Staphylococcus saprophyticus]